MRSDTDVRSASAADTSYAQLRRMLAAGDFAPGQRLLEVELTTRLGVSRTPLREALRRLQSDGMVTLTGRGVVVTQPSPAEVVDLYRYRAALEAFTAELVAELNAAGELAPASVRRLEQLCEEVESGEDAEATAAANLSLHRSIAELSRNSYSIEALSRVWDIISISSAQNLTDDIEWRESIDSHHRSIVAAIAAGDSEGAARAARHHVLAACDVYARQHGLKL
jgi:DNA-binding GntR family transcriptional regulator